MTRRTPFLCSLILAMVVVGLAALGTLGVDRFPTVDLPTINVRTTLPGAAPEEVEQEITRRIEDIGRTCGSGRPTPGAVKASGLRGEGAAAGA